MHCMRPSRQPCAFRGAQQTMPCSKFSVVVKPLFGALIGLLIALCNGAALAHETPVAVLDLREIGAGQFTVEWTYSSSRNMELPEAAFPEQCTLEGRLLTCAEPGLLGRLTVERIGISYSGVVVRLHREDMPIQTFTLTAAQPSAIMTPDGKLPLEHVARSFIPLGFEHIMLGVDHLLFVLGLILLVRSTRMLVKTITAFTIAHSLTLAAASLGWVGVPAASVNALIALSIVVVMVEVVELRRGLLPWGAQYPWAVAFGFGLLHGFGFATALTEQGLPPASLPPALLFFNIGVELGQLAFVFLVLACMWAHRTLLAVAPRWAQTSVIYAVGGIAAFWFLTRVSVIVAPPIVLS